MCLQVRHPGAAPNAVPWSSMEEQLLCAVVHEFGPNFAFAADVLGACSQLQGIFRRASQCREKFKQLTVHTLFEMRMMLRYGYMFGLQLHPELNLYLYLVITVLLMSNASSKNCSMYYRHAYSCKIAR